MKFNPFRPNNIIAPGMFSGRVHELLTTERCLSQTKNGNPQHFIIMGERGIGKSSLMLYVDMMATGNAGVHSKFNFLSVSCDIGACRTQIDVVRTIARELKNVLNQREPLVAKAGGFWSWLTNWEVLGVKYQKQTTEPDAQEAADTLVSKLAELCATLAADIDGVVILLDEADRPDSEANLGEFVKLTSERLARKSCTNVVFGLAGLPNIIAKLRASHESSPRLFETFPLKVLSTDERAWVIERGLELAKEKNGFETKIHKNALEMICHLSEGYPHFVQQFGFSAFDHDEDNFISVDDVANSAFKKDSGALAQLGGKYFNDMYHARVSSPDYRRVLDALAVHGDDYVSRKDIITESGLSETTVTNALSALRARDIIILDDTRRGFYRLPTRSFATWIKAIKETRSQSGGSSAAGDLY